MANPILDTRFAQTRWNVTFKAGRSIKYIVCHYTGTDASAFNNCKYFSGGDRNASADFFIDKDGSIYQFNGDIANYYAWHCGDGNGAYGISNANSIGIEVVSSGAEYTDAQKKALRDLVPWLMAKYGVSASNVVRHYDASRKICPAPYAGSAAKDAKWAELRAYITGGKAAIDSTPAVEGSIDELAKRVINGDFGNGEERKAALGSRYSEVQARVNEMLAGETSAPAPKPSKTLEQIADEVIQGLWGNGDERKKRLEAAGYSYSEVQAIVNQKLSGTPAKAVKDVDTVAREVIAGKWKNGEERRALLTEAGYDYSAVQARVNEILGGSSASAGKSVDELAHEVLRGDWGNGEERRQRLTAAGYDYNAVQARVNQLL